MVGGTGTISYDATKYFLSQGHEVYLLNRGHRNDLKHDNLKYIIGDAGKYEELEYSLKEYTFDVILDFIMFNVEQMKNRLSILTTKCKQYIFISSATVYKLLDEVITEDTPLGNPKWKYSRDKLECEEYLKEHASEYGCFYTIIRPYITYDDRRLPFPVVTKASYYSLLDRIMHDKPVIICGNGENKLTLTHTMDFAVALEGLLLNPKAQNQAFHITGDCVTTWNEILNVIEMALGVKANPIYIPIDFLAERFISERDELLYDKSCNHVYDNSKICDAVPDFKTTFTVKEGITMTVQNLMKKKDLQRIDSIWNYTEDVIINQYEKQQGMIVHKVSVWSKMMYWVYQKSDLVFLRKVLSKIRRMRGKI